MKEYFSYCGKILSKECCEWYNKSGKIKKKRNVGLKYNYMADKR